MSSSEKIIIGGLLLNKKDIKCGAIMPITIYKRIIGYNVLLKVYVNEKETRYEKIFGRKTYYNCSSITYSKEEALQELKKLEN